MGHLGGGNERDVRRVQSTFMNVPNWLTGQVDQSSKQNADPILALIHHVILVSTPSRFINLHPSQSIIPREWAVPVIPTPFAAKVRNALNAEAKSVRLSSLVGAGGLWYGFGKMVMDM